MKLRFADITIEISFWFVAVIALMLTLFPESEALYFFIFCVLHETGHLAAMLAIGKKAKTITFGYFGIKISEDKSFLPAFKEAAIAAGGPCANLFLAAILFVLGKENLATTNLALAFFNVLPVSILDGGHILSALFPDSKAVHRLSICCAVLILIAGIAVAVYSKKNFTLLIVSLYLLIGTVCKKD